MNKSTSYWQDKNHHEAVKRCYENMTDLLGFVTQPPSRDTGNSTLELTRGQKLLKAVYQRPEDFELVKEWKNTDQMCLILKDLKSSFELTFIKTFGIPPVYGCKPDFGFSSKEISDIIEGIETYQKHAETREQDQLLMMFDGIYGE